MRKEDIEEISRQVEAKEKELIRQRKQYLGDSLQRLEWESEYRKYAGVTKRINIVKNSVLDFPFSHPSHWAAFICQGLR
ncbi:hypothetical protein NUACC26_030480 [Scytonema sp. NUACC26]